MLNKKNRLKIQEHSLIYYQFSPMNNFHDVKTDMVHVNTESSFVICSQKGNGRSPGSPKVNSSQYESIRDYLYHGNHIFQPICPQKSTDRCNTIRFGSGELKYKQ